MLLICSAATQVKTTVTAFLPGKQLLSCALRQRVLVNSLLIWPDCLIKFSPQACPAGMIDVTARDSSGTATLVYHLQNGRRVATGKSLE